jgi:hypothetical protein
MLVMGMRASQIKPLRPAAILALLGHSPSAPIIQNMQAQEREVGLCRPIRAVCGAIRAGANIPNGFLRTCSNLRTVANRNA